MTKPIIDQLIYNIRTICKPTIKLVGGASDYEDVIQNAFREETSALSQHPAAYVFNLGKTAEKNEISNSMHQKELQTYGVVLVLDNRKDPRGQTAITGIDELEDLICRAVYNYNPDPTRYVQGFQKVASSKVHATRSELFWMMSFSITAQYGASDGYQIEYADLIEVDVTNTTLDLIDKVILPQL